MQKEKRMWQYSKTQDQAKKNASLHTNKRHLIKWTESALKGHIVGMGKIVIWLTSWGIRWFKWIVGGCPDAASVSFSKGGGDLALPGTGGMAWFSIPKALGGGTTPIIVPTGVPALGEACCCCCCWCCCWRTLSRSCCSTSLAARSGKTWITDSSVCVMLML